LATLTNEKLTQENAVLKRAASFLPKHKVDVVAQFADSLNIYALHYDPIKNEFSFSDGETLSTLAIIEHMEVSDANN
jgi:hypothetical protein